MIEYLFVAAALLSLARAIAGPSFADRVIAVGSVISMLVILMSIHAVSSGIQMYLDVAIAITMLSFVGTLAVAKFIRPREADK